MVRAINPPPDTHIPAHIPTHNLFGVYWSYNARVGVDQCTYTVTHYYTMPPDTASQIDCLRITVLSCLFAPMSLYPSVPESLRPCIPMSYSVIVSILSRGENPGLSNPASG